jgi:hypothetical protein
MAWPAKSSVIFATHGKRSPRPIGEHDNGATNHRSISHVVCTWIRAFTVRRWQLFPCVPVAAWMGVYTLGEPARIHPFQNSIRRSCFRLKNWHAKPARKRTFTHKKRPRPIGEDDNGKAPICRCANVVPLPRDGDAQGQDDSTMRALRRP